MSLGCFGGFRVSGLGFREGLGFCLLRHCWIALPLIRNIPNNGYSGYPNRELDLGDTLHGLIFTCSGVGLSLYGL